MTDAHIVTLCKPLNLGTELRMKMAAKKLREKDAPPAQHVPESGSGWVDVSTGRELPLSVMRGAANGALEVPMALETRSACPVASSKSFASRVAVGR